jgi:hypothetical protein
MNLPRPFSGAPRFFILLPALIWIAALGPAQDSPPSTTVGWNDPRRMERLAAIAPGTPRSIPDDLFTEEFARKLRQTQTVESVRKAKADAAGVLKIPDETFVRWIPEYSALPAHGRGSYVCAFCDKKCHQQDADGPNRWHPSRPGQVRRPCCGTVLYEREEDFPPDYAYRPNGEIRLRHLDGAERSYPYWKGRNRRGTLSIFFSRSEVWHGRQEWLRRHAVPSLAEAYLRTGEEEYARKGLLILERFARIYPALPLWREPPAEPSRLLECFEPGSKDWIVAPGKDGKPLTRREFDSWPRPSPFRRPPWGGANRLGIPMLSADFYCGTLDFARAWLILKNSRTLRESPGELGQTIRSSQFAELALELSGAPLALGNYSMSSCATAVFVGAAARNEPLYNQGIQLADFVLLNHVWPDGSFAEGSLPYQRQMSGYHESVRNMLASEADRRDEEFPFARFARANLPRVFERMSTFAGVGSGHGDGHDGAPIGDAPEPTAAAPPSGFLPSWGFARLSAGRAGDRVETLFLFDKGVGHTHHGNLNLQLAFEGRLVASETGYCAWWRSLDLGDSNPHRAGIFKSPFRFPLLDLKPPASWGEAWSTPNVWSYSHCGALQNTALVEECPGRMWGTGRQVGLARPITLSADAGQGLFQVVEAEVSESMRAHGISCSDYRRAVALIGGPKGRPYVVDCFRIEGGKRHEYMFKLPRADRLDASLDRGEPAADLWNRLRLRWGAEIPNGIDYLRGAELFRPPAAGWRLRWLWNPSLFTPAATPEPERGKNVVLSLHGVPFPSPVGVEEEIWRSKAHLPTRISLDVGGSKQTGTVAFQDGMDVYTYFRGGRRELSSRFAHLFELHAADSEPHVVRVARVPLAVDGGQEDPTDIGLLVEHVGGQRDLLISTLRPGIRRFRMGGLEGSADGRFLFVRIDDKANLSEAALVDGSFLDLAGVRLESDGNLTGEIVEILGDVTGTRKECALWILPPAAWPEGKILAGECLHVGVSADHEDVYEIERVSKQGRLVRVDLLGTPPLAYHWDRVREISSDSPARLGITSLLMMKPVDNGFFRGKRILFPTLNKEFAIRDVARSPGESHPSWIEVAGDVDLASHGVKAGDPFLVYGISPGQKVRVSTRVTLRGMTAEEARIRSNVGTTVTHRGTTHRCRVEELGGGERVLKFR